jgi:hypothetical protein
MIQQFEKEYLALNLEITRAIGVALNQPRDYSMNFAQRWTLSHYRSLEAVVTVKWKQKEVVV